MAATCTTLDFAGHKDAPNKKDKFESGNFGRGHLTLNTLYFVPCCGEIQQWDIYVEQPGTVHLQVWRSSTSGYQLVGQNNLTFTSDGLKEQEIVILPAQRIHVQENDLIGWYSPVDEVIPYKSEGSGSTIIQESMAMVSIGGVFDWSSGTHVQKRTYAIKALLAPGSNPVMVTFPASVTFSHMTSIGTSVYLPVISGKDETTTYIFTLSGTGPFVIDSGSGNITTSSSVTVGTYSLSVTVTDACGRSQTQSFNAIFTNMAPVISGLPYSADLQETTVQENFLHSISIEDGDGDSYTCMLENTSPSSGNFFVKANYSITLGYDIVSKSNPALSYASTNTYTLNISCSDGIDTSYGIFTVYIIQNIAPSFTNLPYSLILSTKSTAVGTSVYKVQTADPDSSTLSTSSTCSPLPCPFSVASDGTVTSITDLRTETTVSYTLQLYVNDSLVTTGPSVLTITLTDLNTAPTFLNLPKTVYVSEHISESSVIYQISAQDLDVSDVLSTTFTIQPPAGTLLLNINATDLTVRRNSGASFNYENLSANNYTISVTTTDGILSTTFNLMISILDDNDPPSFNQNIYYVTSNEGQKGTSLPPVGFGVSDEDISDTFTFGITDGSNFVINASTGIISLLVDIEVNSTTSFNLTVKITDTGGLSDTCTVVIAIQNVNKKPYFTNLPQTVSVPENTASGSSLFSLGLSDEDLTATTVSYIVSPALSSNLFFFNDSERKLYLANGFYFDYEGAVVYNLTFEANDGTEISDPAILYLEIANVNEPPIFQSTFYYLSFNENKSGYALPNIAYDVTDPDAGDIVTFGIIDGHFMTKIGINSGTGQMHLTADILVDSTLTSNLSVQATDSNGLSSKASIEITVYNVNNAPYFTNLPFTANTDENISPGSVVYDVTARDDDVADVCSCSGTFSPSAAATLLHFDSADQKVKLRANATLDHQLLSSVIVTVYAWDLAGATSTSNLTLNIVNINEPPKFSSNIYYGDVHDGTLGSPVTASISAVDPDVTDILTFSLISQSVSGIFNINTSSGIIYTAVDDPYSKSNGNCTLVIQVQDQYGAYDQASVIISINHFNTKPEIANFTGLLYVSEALSSGSLLTIYSIIDPDTNDVITERINLAHASAENKFLFNISNRQLYVFMKDLVDFESKSSYNLTFILNDGYNDSPLYELMIAVADVNESPFVQYSIYHVTVQESTSGTVLNLNITISDPDIGDTATCIILSGNDNQYFSIHPTTCTMSLAKDYDIDSELPSSHSLIVKVVDNKGLFTTTTVNINVVDINDNYPRFEWPEYITFIASDSIIGSQLLTMNVSDSDSGLNAKLTCQMDPHHYTSLFVVSTNCILYQSESLDGMAEGTEVNFTTVVEDAGSPSLSASALVRVIVQGTVNSVAPQASATYQVTNDSEGIDFSDWRVLAGCGTIGLVCLLAIVNSVILFRRGCSKTQNFDKDHTSFAKEEGTVKEDERKQNSLENEKATNNRRSSKNSVHKVRRLHCLYQLPKWKPYLFPAHGLRISAVI
ncbi:cadherin-23-like isoform X2 [Saccostrea cucullata]|uniref:cadherin-23-like isoform X2 n=1 Tax=Saccostrea cuccullata TaxID=36930 RepID=UPI002ED64741